MHVMRRHPNEYPEPPRAVRKVIHKPELGGFSEADNHLRENRCCSWRFGQPAAEDIRDPPRSQDQEAGRDRSKIPPFVRSSLSAIQAESFTPLSKHLKFVELRTLDNSLTHRYLVC